MIRKITNKFQAVFVVFVLLLCHQVGAITYQYNFAGSGGAKKSGSRMADIEIERLENHNSIVRILSRIVGMDYIINIPGKMSANDFVELLILGRTLVSSGVDSILLNVNSTNPSVKVVDSQGRKIQHLPIEKLLSISGFDIIDINGSIREIETATISMPRPHRKKNMSSSQSELIKFGNSQLLENFSSETGIKVVNRFSGTRAVKDIFLFLDGSQDTNERLLKSIAEIARIKKYRNDIKINLIAPYLPYARSDKKDQYGVTVTGRLVLDLFQVMNINSLTFVHAHAPQSEGYFIGPTFHVSAKKTIVKYLKSNNIEVIVGPDMGFQKEATALAKELGVPVVIVNKSRNPRTGRIVLEGVNIPNDLDGNPIKLEGKKVAIVDDETASGGTLAEVAELIIDHLEVGQVTGVVTHFNGSAQKAIDSRFLHRLVTTNTVQSHVKNEKVVSIDVTTELIEALDGIIPSNSSDLFCQRLIKGGGNR